MAIFQNAIPKPPIPLLEHTLKRYQEYVSVVVNNDQMKLSRIEKAVAEFRIIGTRLQKKLEKIANEEDNWVKR
uniref:Choline/carnitine acyltransferase domain-containing protein n=1 Tax=Setaria digitata TaxID=48799 RepID=A0A915PQ51_9BILA